jgi:two-component system, NtrC family, response regulator HydG
MDNSIYCWKGAMNQTAPAILVVDDEIDTCRNLSDILGDFGYQVETAQDGPSALELVRRSAFDVALLDLKMPGMDGLTLYREIKKLRPDMVAMIVSAFANEDAADEASATGIWKVLAKPVDLSRLLPLVDEAVNQPLVLVVDDDPDLCASLWDLLRDQGYRVGLAHDESTTLAHVQQADYRVVLIDMKLPDADGASVFRHVRQANPEARVMLITGFRHEVDDLIREAMSEGADAICYKPFDIPQLLEVLQRLTKR